VRGGVDDGVDTARVRERAQRGREVERRLGAAVSHRKGEDERWI
jgi:hypothetical protein